MSEATPPAEPPKPSPGEALPPEGVGFDLLMYGNEQILQGSDTGTLVAFAALAYQQIRGKGEPHHSLGCGILLLSVLLCAIVHFSVGQAYIGRARSLLRQKAESRRSRLLRRTSYGFAWFAASTQFLFVIAGTLLIITEKPPAFVQKYVMPWFGGL